MLCDADLNSLFAEKVAGWVPYIAPKNKGSLLLPYKWFDGSGHPQVAIANFTASMDAVLPWLEKKEVVEVIYNDNPYTGSKGYSVQVADSFTEDLKEPSGRSGWVKDPSLPRACVLALLRAAGVAV